MALKGNQKKLDKNNNNRIDAEDFKLLKQNKKMSGGMAAGGGKKNYKMTGQVGKAKYGKMMKKA
jgi:hypothetical protein|tara:strand:- start:775 stop:966 length:192 start_codon:yes stop_codon:yes gene_type:complete